MESINLQPANQTQLLVLPLGFNDAVIEKLNNIFRLTRPSERCYSLVSVASAQVAILLVNYDNPQAIAQKEHLFSTTCAKAQLVATSQGPLSDSPPYHLRGLLTGARLLTLLDSVPFENQTVSNQAVKADVIAFSDYKTNTGYRALVVDDSLAIQKAIELRLAQLPQITVIDFADDGESALIKAASHYYDLIFLDVMMPGIDGYQTCTELRKDSRYKKTPIIMVSGKSSPLDEVKGIIAGCTTYLIKPIQEDAFHKLSMRVLAWLAEQRANN